MNNFLPGGGLVCEHQSISDNDMLELINTQKINKIIEVLQTGHTDRYCVEEIMKIVGIYEEDNRDKFIQELTDIELSYLENVLKDAEYDGGTNDKQILAFMKKYYKNSSLNQFHNDIRSSQFCVSLIKYFDDKDNSNNYANELDQKWKEQENKIKE